MKFIPTEPNINLDLMAWRSETGEYELGFRSMLYGIRVSLLSANRGFYALDYCCGTDGPCLVIVFRMLRTALLGFDETTTERQLQDYFPRQNNKPMLSDIGCFLRLMELETAAKIKYSEQIELIYLFETCAILAERFRDRFARLEAFRAAL